MGISNFSELETDAGPVASGTPGSHIPDLAALAALTSAAATGGDAPTEGEYNALQADVAALHTVLGNVRTKLNSALAALREFGVLESS